MSADPVVVTGVSSRLHKLAVDLWARGDRNLARALERESKVLARPAHASGCKGCAARVPEVEVGRPRLYCYVCRPRRVTKVGTKVPESATVDP